MHPVFRCQQSPRICCSMNINHLQTVFIETCLRTSLSLPVFVLPIMSRCQLLNHHKSKLVNGPACNTHTHTHTHTHTQTKRVLINIKNTKTVSRHALKNTLQHTHTHTHESKPNFLPSFLRTASQLQTRFPLSSHLVQTINFLSFFSSGEGERNNLNLRGKERLKKREAELSWQSVFEGHWGVCGAETKLKKKKNLPQFHFTGGPINLCTPTHTYTHMHHSSDKQAHTHTHTHTHRLFTLKTFANLHTMKEQTLQGIF